MKSNPTNYLSFFPENDKARPHQVQALNEITNIFSTGKKYIIACLPTGSGKSHIASSVARASNKIDDFRKQLIESYSIYKKDKYGSYEYEEEFEQNPFGSFILTVTKSLQDQYKQLFPNTNVIKGKSNYICAVDTDVTVNTAPCLYSKKLKEKCFSLNRCPYYEARKNALISIDPILNYRSFISLPPFLRNRETYICDEASDLEAEIVSHYSLTITYSQLENEGIDFIKLKTDDSKIAGNWIRDLFLNIKSEVDSAKIKISKMSKDDISASVLSKETQRLSKLSDIQSSMESIVEYWEECEYIVEERDAKKVTVVPYDIKPLAINLFSGAKKIILMSATITNHEEFAKSLGIPSNEYDYIEIPSVFDHKKSPIKSSRKYSLSYKTNNVDLPKIIETALHICEEHSGEKGIIHTHTHQITEMFKKMSKGNKRFLFRETGVTNETIIDFHKNSEDDTILVSPSLTTGISLDDHLGRFQVILKAPFLPLSSKRIKKIYEKNKNYYTMKMLDTLIQMCGRCTRSVEDYSTTYILDGNAVNSILQNKKFLPKSFLERLL